MVLVDADAAAGAEYGTASTHKEISLGRADFYKLYAVLDSEDASANPVLPQFTVTGVSGTSQKVKLLMVRLVDVTQKLLIQQIQLLLS